MNQQHLGLPGVLEIDRSSRDPLDRYYTPDRCLDQLAAASAEHDGLFQALLAAKRGVLEPSAGGGACLRGLRRIMDGRPVLADRHPERIVAVDLDPRPDGVPLGWDSVEWIRSDFFDVRFEIEEFGLAIGNPPFAFAEEFVRRCRAISRYTLMLLRLTFLESAARGAWLAEDAPDVFVLARRPRFDGTGGTDSVTSAWMLWHPSRRRTGTIEVLP